MEDVDTSALVRWAMRTTDMFDDNLDTMVPLQERSRTTVRKLKERSGP